MTKSIAHRILKAIMFGRFEPVETVLSISAVLHGAWLLFPYWGTQGPLVSATNISRSSEFSFGLIFALLGLLHLFAMGLRENTLRRHVAFVKFLFWGFLAWVAMLTTSASSIIWVAYLTIMLISGIIYLNISVGVENG